VVEARLTFCEVLQTRGVVLWGLCCFCIKFAVYSLLLWMPLFLDNALGYCKQDQANLLSLFEVGVIVGIITLGFFSDCIYSRRSPLVMLFISLSCLICFCIAFRYETMSPQALAGAMFFFGFFLGSVKQMINTTCAADLGREIKGKRATATITSIIDACGNSGAGLGQIVLGSTIEAYGWRDGYLLVLASVIGFGLVPLSPVFCREVGEIKRITQSKDH